MRGPDSSGDPRDCAARLARGRVDGLEGENGAALGPEIAPNARRDAVHERKNSRGIGHAIGLVERLLEGKGHPVVEFVVESAGVQGTLMPGTRGAEAQHIPILGEVLAVVEVHGPTHVAALWISSENAGERQAEVDESALTAHRLLRRYFGSSACRVRKREENRRTAVN